MAENAEHRRLQEVAAASRRAAPTGAGQDRSSSNGRGSGRRSSPKPGRAPKGPTDIRRGAWGGVLKRTIAEFKKDNLTIWAAALTYYGILAIFPALLALISILGLIGTSATQPLIDNLSSVATGPAKQIITSAIQNLQGGKSAAGVLFVVALAGALYSASGYVGAFMQASNAIYEVGEGRPIWKALPTRIGITLVLLLMLALAAVGVTFTGGLAVDAGKLIGVGSAAVAVWDLAKWPVILIIVMTMLSILYWASPNVRHRFRWASPGAVLGVVLWLAASAGFALYVANFAHYNKTYGALGGVIVFLVWLWISNIAVLLGAEFNAEIERAGQIQAGRPGNAEPFLEPRDTHNL
ncbi:MAG: rane protein [Solirubrobacteraceae bacterium]|nr:rane protein [Solirubrobacteraceae bacterium]MEA2354303.1 rane protein [Solirubrobacteraceae bacterium]